MGLFDCGAEISAWLRNSGPDAGFSQLIRADSAVNRYAMVMGFEHGVIEGMALKKEGGTAITALNDSRGGSHLPMRSYGVMGVRLVQTIEKLMVPTN
jgi:hypothetical protein